MCCVPWSDWYTEADSPVVWATWLCRKACGEEDPRELLCDVCSEPKRVRTELSVLQSLEETGSVANAVRYVLCMFRGVRAV